MGQCIVLLGKKTPPPLILSFVLNLNLNRILCTINRLAGCFEPEVRTGPKNVAVSDWQAQLFAFAVTTAVQKYERQHIVW